VRLFFRIIRREEIMKVRKTEIVLGPTIPINFGAYAFRPPSIIRTSQDLVLITML
jgi:hypothetical protein